MAHQHDREQADRTIAEQRAIQEQVARTDARQQPASVDAPMQGGPRRYPEPPMPSQHLLKPGAEGALDPAPMWQAPYWRGSAKLEGQVAIVTGGDSGIGRAVAVLFAREGADVAILHLNEDEDAAVTIEAIEREGRRGLAISGDVRERDFCFRAVEQVVGTFGRLDVLVNNAAFQLHTYRLEDLTEAHLELTLKTNLCGYIFMAQAALPHLKEGAAIVNTGSVTGLYGNKNLLDYATTKGGIHAFTRSLSSQLIPRGIRVNAVAPGPVWTPLNPSDQEADKVPEFGTASPVKRPAQPEELAPAYLFLASAQMSSYITGEVLPVIGGYESR